LVRASRSCTSAKKATRICARYWCREHNIFWDHSGSTAISGVGAWSWPSAAGRTERNERSLRLRESWQCCCITCGSAEKCTNRCTTAAERPWRQPHKQNGKTKSKSFQEEKKQEPKAEFR